MAHILFLEWNSFGNEFVKRAWERANDTYVSFAFSTKDNTRYGAELTKKLVLALMAEPFDYLFSFNYFPVAAMAAKACRVRYVSWVYDSPYAQLYSETIAYDTNDVRIFDSHEAAKLQEQGIQTVRYLPLAADVSYYDTFLPKDGDAYACDVSFVGALYTEEKQQLYRRLEALPDYQKGYLDGLVAMQKQIYGMNFMEDMLSEELLLQMQQVAPLQAHPDAFATPAWYYANFYLNRQVTALERTQMLTMLAKNTDAVMKVFTKEAPASMAFAEAQGVCCPAVDYYREVPYVYKNSKINLNITLKSIQHGIPLRAFDIMGCGGFLLSNYQQDLCELFEPNVDFVYYEDEQDLLQKVRYYLSHDEERRQIAQHGYETVKQYHSYDARIKTFTD